MRKQYLFILLLAACPVLAQERPQAQVDKAIAYAGGWEKWTATRTLQFRKTITRFAPDGSVTSTRVQLHRYQMLPTPRMRIEWEDNGASVVMINDGQDAQKFVDGKRATTQADVNSARGSTFGSHYVFGMPFKLRDSGTLLAEAGSMNTPAGAIVQKLRVTYDKDAGDAGGLHTWTYMFDAKTGRLVCNLLQYEAEKFDWTEYYDEKSVDGLIFATRRVGFNADATGRIGPKQSEIIYDQIRRNVDLDPKLFVLPP